MAPEQPTAGRAILTTATRSTGRTSRRREQERTGPRYTFQKSCGVLKPLSESLPGSSPQCFMRRQQMRPNATAYRLCGCGCGVPTPPATKTHSRRGHVKGRPTQFARGHYRQRAESMRRHGHAPNGARSPEYTAWSNLVQRCTNEKHPSYPNYGGRGIAVCTGWRTSFTAFLADVGPRPSAKHSLGRIDNGQGYCSGNVRWELGQEQNRNTRRNPLVTWRDQTHTLAGWAELLGISRRVLTARRASGWRVERMLSQPARRLRIVAQLPQP